MLKNISWVSRRLVVVEELFSYPLFGSRERHSWCCLFCAEWMLCAFFTGHYYKMTWKPRQSKVLGIFLSDFIWIVWIVLSNKSFQILMYLTFCIWYLTAWTLPTSDYLWFCLTLAWLKFAVCNTLFLEVACLLKRQVNTRQPSYSLSLQLNPMLGSFWAASQKESRLHFLLVRTVFSCCPVRRLNY